MFLLKDTRSCTAFYNLFFIAEESILLAQLPDSSRTIFVSGPNVNVKFENHCLWLRRSHFRSFLLF
jgi:hypothetical protein